MDDLGSVTKVTRLPVRTPVPDLPVDEVSLEVARLLADAEALPEIEHRPASGPPGHLRVPDASHRNALACPQCDGPTWRWNPLCSHCGFDLAGHAWHQAQEKRLAESRARERRRTRWTIGTAIAALIVLGLSALLPIAFGLPIATLALATIVMAYVVS